MTALSEWLEIINHNISSVTFVRTVGGVRNLNASIYQRYRLLYIPSATEFVDGGVPYPMNQELVQINSQNAIADFVNAGTSELSSKNVPVVHALKHK